MPLFTYLFVICFRPGKHYEYISKYTLFLIDLAKESNDIQTLKHLYRKLRRAQNMVLHDKKVYQQAYCAYLEVCPLCSMLDNHYLINIVKICRL